MTFQEMIEAINRRVDDVVDTADAIEWLNAGKNQLAIAVGAKFPDIDPANLDQSFPFDDKYHEAPVLYACARFKEQDGSLGEAANYMAQFEFLKREFVTNYVVPPRYLDTRNSQQFVVQEGQALFTITKESYDRSYGDLKVYLNDEPAEFCLGEGNTFMLLTPCKAGDIVTAVWEEHADLVQPPYNWWGW